VTDSQLQPLSDLNQDVLDGTIWAIENYQEGELAEKFAIVLCLCNSHRLWQNVVEHLRVRETLDIVEIQLSPSVTTLYSTLSASIEAKIQSSGGRIPHAIVVSGLSEVCEIDALLANAKLIIEELAKTFPFPFLWHVTDDVLQRLIRLAPDIYSRATVEEFEQSIEDTLAFIDRTADEIFDRVLDSGAGRFLDNADLKLDRSSKLFWELNTARQTLQDEGMPLSTETQANLEFLLGNAGELTTPKEQHYERSLTCLQEGRQAVRRAPSQDDSEPTAVRSIEKQGCVLYCLGALWRTRAEFDRRAYDANCEKARAYFQHCVDLFEQERRFDLVAKFINALGDILQRQRRWDELQTVGVTATVLHRSYPNAFRLARAYNFLAEAAIAREDWKTALDNAQQALSISRHATPDERITDASQSKIFLEWVRSFNQGAYYFTLARAQAGSGQLDERLKSLEIALTKTKPDYEPQLYAQILKALRTAYFQHGDYLNAFRLRQQQYALEHQYGFRAFIGAGRLQPSKSANAVDLETGRQIETVARAIEASGRIEDVNRLVERIGRVDSKLTVLYGQSGVGKSSLLQAGLVPSLCDRSIGSRDVVPVLLQVYTDWVARLADLVAARLSVVGHEKVSSAADLDALSQQLQENVERNLLTVLIFDQFEEFFFTYTSAEDRLPFYQFLHECLNLPYIKVVLALREDCLHYLLEIGRCIDLAVVNHDILDKNVLYYLGDLSAENAKSVVASLTEQSRQSLEPALIDRLVEDLISHRAVRCANTVRPIELQIVGAQLQTERVTTLQQYLELGNLGGSPEGAFDPKETLVQRYLADTLTNCGPENQQIAQLVLYLLTNENNTRPIKTRIEVEKELRSRSAELDISDETLALVFQVFVESGLVFLFPEAPIERYQLVHDYLVRYIRHQEGAQLIEKLERLEAQRREQEQKLNRVLKRAFLGASIAAVLTTALALTASQFARRASFEKQRAEEAQERAIDSLSRYSLELSFEQFEFDALLESLRLGQLLKVHQCDPATHNRSIFALQQAVYWIREQNRLSGHDSPISDISWSPDGTYLASVDDLGTLRLWTRSGHLQRAIAAHDSPIDRVRFSPDGQRIATGGTDGTVKLWNSKGEEMATFSFAQQFGTSIEAESATSLSWHPRGDRLAIGTERGTVEVLSISEEGEIDRLLGWRGHDEVVSTLEWHPDGTRLVSGSWDRTVKIWDDRGRVLKTLDRHTGKISSVRWHPRGDRLAIASADGIVKIWREIDNTTITLERHGDWVTSLSWHPDGSRLASGSWDRTIQIWDVEGREIETLWSHIDGISSLQWSPDGDTLATATRLYEVKLWNMEDRHLQALQAHSDGVNRVRWHPRGDRFATASQDGTVKIWDLNGRLLARFGEGERNVTDLAFNSGGDILAVARENEATLLWNIPTNSVVATLEEGNTETMQVAFSPDDRSIATTGDERTVILWNLQGERLQTLTGHEDTVTDISFHPDGQLMATASYDRTVRLWNLKGEQVYVFPDRDHDITQIAWNDDGTILAVAGRDRAIALWSVFLTPNGEQLSQPAELLNHLWGHVADVTGLDWHPDGEMLVSSSSDKMVKVWNLDGEVLKTLERRDPIGSQDYSSWMTDAQFDPTGDILVSSDSLGRVQLWRELNSNLDTLIERGCDWLTDYFRYNPDAPPDVRELCKEVERDRS